MRAVRCILLLPAVTLAALGRPEPAAVPLQPAYRIWDGGQPRVLELALDELGVVTPDGRRAARKIPAASSPDALRAHARQAQTGQSEPVDLVLYPRGAARTAFTRRYATRNVLVETDPTATADDLLRTTGARRMRTRAFAPRWAVLEVDGPGDALAAVSLWAALPGVVSAEPLLARLHAKKTVPDDPYFSSQWHLRNVGQGGGAWWIDANLTAVWDRFRGAGITIAIVDDGVQHAHPDLAPNYDGATDYDFNDHDGNAAPVELLSDTHGTQVAGVAAARGSNAVGVAGVAYQATLTGLRLIGDVTTDEQDADAFAYSNDVIHVKNNSWGVPDDGATLEGPGPLALAALEDGVTRGRGGRGVIYVFSGGNGLDVAEDSNCDGFANSIYTIAVGAVDDAGFQAWYSEPGANLAVCAPSDDGFAQAGITTTDITGDGGDNTSSSIGDLPDRNYTRLFGGTSSAAPLVSGVIALMLEANPDLGWRDVQEILLCSARRNHSADADWSDNGAGLRLNHKYGAGIVDAQAAVGAALNWTNRGPQTSTQLQQTGLNVTIPDNNSNGVTRTFSFSAPGLRVERAAVTVTIEHPFRGDLEITLVSPTGTCSRLAQQHFDGSADYADWTFTSVRHWGESASGAWTVRGADRAAGHVGALRSVRVKLYGSTVPGPRPVAAGAALTAESNLPANGAADPGETVTVRLGLKNLGGAATTNLVATLLAAGGVSQPSAPRSYGALAPGATAHQSFSFKTSGACGTSATALLALRDGDARLGVVSFPIVLGRSATATFSNTAGITIPEEGSGSPCPSTITVGGLSGRVHQVTAQLNSLSHTYLEDISSLLVAPGDLQILLQDSGIDAPVSGLNWTFDGNAPTYIPATVSQSGMYKPTTMYDAYPPAAPDGELAFTMGEFNGVPPNGAWGLYLYDWNTGDSGRLGNWRLTFTTMDCTDNVLCEPNALGTDERAGAVTVTVARTAGREGSAAVRYATRAGSALAGVDYVAASGTLSFAAGETAKGIPITLINDTLWEGAETFRLDLFGVTGNSALGAATSAVITVSDGDFDGDGIPDDWETTYGLSPTNAADGLGDGDRDGLSNAREFFADCNPTSAASCLQITDIRPHGGGLRVQWRGGAQARQWLEGTSDLLTPTAAWAPLLTNSPPTPLTNAFIHTNGSSALYYRVRARRD